MSTYNYNNQIPVQTQIADSDKIIQLPVDSSKPTKHELNIINNLFKQPDNSSYKQLISLLILLMIHLVISLPYLDSMIETYIPNNIGSNIYFKIILKGFLLISLYYAITTVYFKFLY